MVEQTTQVCPPIKKLSKKLKKVNTFEKAFSKEERERGGKKKKQQQQCRKAEREEEEG